MSHRARPQTRSMEPLGAGLMRGAMVALAAVATAALGGLPGCKGAPGGGPSPGSGGSSGSQSGGKTGTATGGSTSGATGGATGSGGQAPGPGSGGGTASGGASGPGSGGDTAGTSSGGSSAGSGGMTGAGTGGATDGGMTGGMIGGGDDGGTTDAACQMARYTFQPTIPTVYVMVDRSGSMFDCLSTTDRVENSCMTPADTSWVKLRDAALSVVGALQGQVRFGFASFTGTDPAHGGKCPQIDQVAPALNNLMPISDVYTKLPFQPDTNETGKKFETPARQALDMIGAKLLADTTPGGKFILFVTDGQPDYCDDSNTLCAPDSVIGGLQAMKTMGVTTIVFGLQSKGFNLPAGTLQAFANAGAGEPAVMPLSAGADMNSIWDQCNGLAPWKADLTTTGKEQVRGTTVGTYSPTAGPTKPFTPNAADQAMLVTQLTAALSSVKSCTFDLGNIDGQSIKVDPMQLGAAHVCMDKTCPSAKEIPQDATNGWSLSSGTQIILNGTACTSWRMPNNNDIAFDFPCKSIIFE